MEPSEIVVSLDIGTTKIAVIVGRRNEFGKIEILGMGKTESVGVSRGIPINIEKTVQSIRRAVEEAEKQSHGTIQAVNVGIAGQHIKSLQHRGNIMRNSLDDEIAQFDIDLLVESMNKLVMQPGEAIIHVIPQEYIVDNQAGIKDPIGMAGICLEANFHIITGQVTAAKNIEKCITKAGMEITEVILEPLASAEAVLSEEEKEAGVVLVDIGGGTTDIAIFQDGIIRHTAVIPLGGNVITDDIREGCSIIRNQAEILKIKFGSTLSSENRDDEIVAIQGLKGREPKEISLRNLASIIQARMEEIIENVYFEIKNSGFEKKLIGGIVLTGGGAQMKHIVQLTQFITGMDTRIGYPTEHLSNNVPDEIKSTMYATGVGLIIKALERIDKQKNRTTKPSINNQSKAKVNFLDKLFAKSKSFFDDDKIN